MHNCLYSIGRIIKRLNCTYRPNSQSLPGELKPAISFLRGLINLNREIFIFSLLSQIYGYCKICILILFFFFPGKDYGSGSSGQYLQIPQPA